MKIRKVLAHNIIKQKRVGGGGGGLEKIWQNGVSNIGGCLKKGGLGTLCQL